jgi:exodeoxyribonuclease-3
MRIATWNVNSLKARQEAVDNWLARAKPDLLLMQETKLGDADAPVMAFAMHGYQLVHHGEGRWNGVAIAARDGLAVSDVVTNFGDGPVRDSGPGGLAADVSEDDFDPFDEARMVAATVDGLRVASVYAPNGRVVGSPFYEGKLAWFERLGRWLDDEVAAGRGASLVVGGDYNVAPTDADVWDPRAAHGGTHVSAPERAAVAALLDRGLTDAYRTRHDEPGRFSWWDYRAGMFHKNFGMRIDLLLVGADVAARIVDAEIDREARKGPKPIPSDHAPVTLDLDEPGAPIDPDWEGALARIAKRAR